LSHSKPAKQPYSGPRGGPRSNPVLFDSSFLMAVSKNPTTWFEDITDAIGMFEPVLLDCVSRELERLASSQGSRSKLAKVALELGLTFDRAPCGQASVDDEIASAARSLGARVATTDSELAKSLRASHLGVVTLKSGRAVLG